MIRLPTAAPHLRRCCVLGALRSSAPVRSFSADPSAIVLTLTESLQSVHAMSGLPYWALIPVTTVVLRLVWTFPLAVMQRFRMQRQNSLRPIVSATGPVLRLNLAKKATRAAERASSAVAGADDAASVASLVSPLKGMRYEEIMVLSSKETRKRQKRLFKEHGVQLWKNMLLPVAQVPLWVAMLITFRNLSGWLTWDALSNKPLDPALYNEGLWWFQDLTVLDPYHIFPLAVGVVALVNVEWTFKTIEMMRPTASRARVLRATLTDSMANVSRMAVVFLMAISLHAPTALTLYWLSSQVFSLVQNVFLDLVIPMGYTTGLRRDTRPLSAIGAQSILAEVEEHTGQHENTEQKLQNTGDEGKQVV